MGKEVPIIHSSDVQITDYRSFAPEPLHNSNDWGIFTLLVADVHQEERESTHVVGLLSHYASDKEILEFAQRVSARLECSNMRIFLAGIGTVREIGALYSAVTFFNIKDGSTMETIPPRPGASLDVLVEDDEIKEQLRSVRLDANKPRFTAE